MRALSLFGVLLAAKIVLLAGLPIGWSAWTLPALLSQDVLVAAVAGAIEAIVPRRSSIVLYWIAAIWIAINVPIAAVVGSPLTPGMLRAARGPLSDSIALYLTAGHLLPCLACLAVAWLLPAALMWRPASAVAFVGRALRPGARGGPEGPYDRRFASALLPAIAVAVLAIAIGPAAASRADVSGLDRNAFTALVPTALPTVVASSGAADWRLSPYAGVTSTGLTALAGSARGMNILVVVLESTAARYLRPYGAPDDPMPRLTALASKAVVVDQAYAVYPESIKGLFVTLCSRYPAFGEPAEHLADVPCTSVASAFHAAGYRTGLFHSGRFGYLGMDAVLADKGFDTLEDAGAIGGNVHSSFGVDEPATVDRLLQWVGPSAAAQPFFAVYLPIAGHHPYAVPTPDPPAAEDDESRYRNALRYADAALGRLVDGLRARDLDRSTMLLVFGDHGEAFGRHPGNIGHTLFINEENVRVPYFVAIPGVTSSPVHAPGPVSVIDTAPTLLDLAGLPSAPEYHGRSLLQPGARMAFFFTDYARGWLGLRDGCWKYLLDVDADRSQLYDICRDPDETHNLAGASSDRAAVYRDRVHGWSRDALTRSAPAPSASPSRSAAR